MSKSMLVIDTPDSCDMCDFIGMINGKMNCKAPGIRKEVEDYTECRPEFCPLKEIKPKRAKKTEEKRVVDYGKILSLYKAGWSQKKIAEEMGVSQNAICVSLKRYKDKLEDGYIWDAELRKFVRGEK